MARFLLFDVPVESELPLPAPETRRPPSLHFTIDERSPHSGASAPKWIVEHFTPADDPWLSIGESAGGHILRFHHHADFEVQHGGRIVCRRMPATPDETVRHLLVSHVLPRVLSSRGELVFHGSAVVLGNRGVAFVGKSGSGKSTLAAGCAARGFPVLTDDGLLIRRKDDRFVIQPSYPEIRVWPDTFRSLFPKMEPADGAGDSLGKFVLAAENASVRFEGRETPIETIMFLNEALSEASTELSIRPVGAGAACFRLMEDMFRLVPPDKSQLSSEFDTLSALTGATPCFELSFPRDHARIEEVVDTVLERFG